MTSSYLNLFQNGQVPSDNSGNLRPDNYSYDMASDRLIKMLRLSNDDCVIDVGCGNGRMMERILGHVKKITAIEGNPRIAEFVKNKFKNNSKVDVSCLMAEKLTAIPSNVYDKYICIAVLQYCTLSEAKMVISEAYRVCKSGGIIYFGDVFDSAVVHDDRDGMSSFDPKILAEGYRYQTILSNFEPERRYDLIIFRD